MERGEKALVRHRHKAVVDQIIDRRLHVDITLDDARLLQREARREDRIPLRGADARMREFGAFFQLLVDDGVGSLVTVMKSRLTSS